MVDFYVLSDMVDTRLRNYFQFGVLFVWGITLVAIMGRYLIHMLEMSYLYYGVENGQFLISKGIFLKQRGSFPLARITDIYLDRKPIDLLFGLYDLHVSTPTASSGNFAKIPGLSKKAAFGLQEKLSSLVEEASHIEGIDTAP